jgi:hypothetical protein
MLPDSAANDLSSSQLSAELRVMVPAIVQSFNATAQTVVVQCALLENVRINGIQQSVDLGLISDVPIQFVTGGTWSLTVPIQAGDECILVFADGCIDAWFQSGGQQSRIDGRRHALSDAIALFGVRSQPRKLTNYSTTSAQLRSDDGDTVIDLAPNVITIKAATITVQGQQVNVTGSTNVAISGNNTTTIDGKNFLLHTHTGVQTGTGISGPVD